MTKTTKEVHDTYKVMYEDISRLLLETQKKYEETSEKIEELSKENARTRSALNRLSRAVEAIQLCPYRRDCPVRLELQDGEGTDQRRNTGGGSRHRGKREGAVGGERKPDIIEERDRPPCEGTRTDVSGDSHDTL